LALEDEEDEFDDTAASSEWLVDHENFDGYQGWSLPDDPIHDVTGDGPIRVSISEFTQTAFTVPRDDGLPGRTNFSFEGRRHMRRPYDTPARRILLCTGRQVEKSTMLGNRAIAYCALVPAFRVLYVSPTSTQTKTFSTDRLKEPIETSETLRHFTTRALSQNVFEKQFVNYSKITLRNAFLNADRVRGIPAWMLLIDEFQDILSDNVPVIEQCTSHAPETWKQFLYAGTPKTLDNNIEFVRANNSTQCEWMVPCDACGGGETGRFWNILGEKNIQPKGLSCERCGALINPQHPDATWAAHVDAESVDYESYRISQLMVPWKAWSEILTDYQNYPRNQFYNEVLGLSYDSGLRPLSMVQVRACCREDITMHPDVVKQYFARAADNPIFAGIDWGGGTENSYTVLVLGTYVGLRFRIFYVHRFTGMDLDVERQLDKIISILNAARVRVIGADMGGGQYQNSKLRRKFGAERTAFYQYTAKGAKKVEYTAELQRYKVFRTLVMGDLFNAIKKRNVFEFPRWAEFSQPFAQDMCNISAEYNEKLRMLQYDHARDRPDDTFHALLYCLLASMMMFPRPDILAPIREDKNRGPMVGTYTGPVNQG